MNVQNVMDVFIDLNSQVSRLNQNLETWIGLVATAQASQETKPALEVAPAPAPVAVAVEPASSETPPAKPRGRPRKVRYWFDHLTRRLEASSDSPGTEFEELTKVKYDEVKAALDAPVEAAPAPEGAQPAADNPFADDEPAAAALITLDQVRAVAFQYRDRFGTDAAKTLIAKYAEKLNLMHEARYADFVAEVQAALAQPATDL